MHLSHSRDENFFATPSLLLLQFVVIVVVVAVSVVVAAAAATVGHVGVRAVGASLSQLY